jgi:hypothetical protein
MIHDLYLLRAVAVNTGKPSSHQARIVRHVLSEAYQNELLSGYGYSYFVNTGTVYSTGWSCHLGTKEDDRGIAPSSILPRLIMLSAFGEARRSAWFAKAKRFLIATYHNRSGVLPSPLLIERSQGYWVEGAFMSFGDTLNSRTRTNIAIQRLQQIGVSDKELKATR